MWLMRKPHKLSDKSDHVTVKSERKKVQVSSMYLRQFEMILYKSST